MWKHRHVALSSSRMNAGLVSGKWDVMILGMREIQTLSFPDILSPERRHSRFVKKVPDHGP
eukprot:11562882-Prorocentrum_lima.AAC.1